MCEANLIGIAVIIKFPVQFVSLVRKLTFGLRIFIKTHRWFFIAPVRGWEAVAV